MTLALAAAAFGAPTYAGQPDEARAVVVYAAKVNLRAEPSPAARIVVVLSEGTCLERVPEKDADNGGYYWLGVRAGGDEGWVADDYVMPAGVYDATRKADSLGRAGDADAMVAELKKVLAARGGNDEDLSVSPDGKKALCRVLQDPADEMVGVDLYFGAGRGVVRKLGESIFLGAVTWSPDGRYWARGGGVTGAFPFAVRLAETADVLFEGVSNRDAFAFAGDNFLYLTTERNDAGVRVPAFYCVPLPDGKPIEVLEADTNDRRDSGAVAEYRMRPVGSPPEAVTSAALYRKYAGEYAPVIIAED